MKAVPIAIWCECEIGTMFKTALRDPEGRFVAFWLTEDECLYFRGYCSKCGHVIDYKYPLMQAIRDCPSGREVF